METKIKFFYKDKIMYYDITWGNNPIKVVKHREKMSLYLSFYDEEKKKLGTINVYDVIEKLQPMSNTYVCEQLEKAIQNKYIKWDEVRTDKEI